MAQKIRPFNRTCTRFIGRVSGQGGTTRDVRFRTPVLDLNIAPPPSSASLKSTGFINNPGCGGRRSRALNFLQSSVAKFCMCGPEQKVSPRRILRATLGLNCVYFIGVSSYQVCMHLVLQCIKLVGGGGSASTNQILVAL